MCSGSAVLHSWCQADSTDKAYKVCEMQVDEVSEMRRTTHSTGKERGGAGQAQLTAGVGPFGHGNVLRLVFSDMW